ncbi:MAG TPA: gamma-glutamyltransferase [Casimicrobiaceae bacterium]|nr:gamma-glutamyltransferase [Casimicrobiaceae bacterium]
MRLRRAIVLVAAWLGGILWAGTCIAQQHLPETASGRAHKTLVTSRHFMAATANPLATQAAYRILRAGGTAADATIAAQLVLGLVEPQSSGLGGGAFLLYHDARGGRLTVLDGRETAPAAARPDRFIGADGKPLRFYEAVVGGRSVGVPGAMRLLGALHARHGRLGWSKLFEPAIELAERGFPISPRLASAIAAETHFRQPRIRSYFLDADGAPKRAGTLLRNPAYAATLRAIARSGPDVYYGGAIAADVVATANDPVYGRGDMTLEDLARYRAIEREPVCDRYRGYKVCGPPPPSSGGIAVLELLKLLEPYDLASMGAATFWSVHFISEAGRLAYADRDYVADPAFAPLPGDLLDDDYLRERSRAISALHSMGTARPGVPPRRAGTAAQRAAWVDGAAAEFPSTSHICIVDRYGNAVSMTTSIEDAFGSRLMTRGGFLLNNELTDFAFVPDRNGVPVANRVQGGKRPRSAMSPTIVYDRSGRLWMIVGSPGGPAIINYVVKTLIGVIDWKLDAQAAVDLPNFGSRNGPTELEADTSVVALEPRLQALGHRTRVTDHPSGVQVILRTRSGYQGGADPRREGVVLGD